MKLLIWSLSLGEVRPLPRTEDDLDSDDEDRGKSKILKAETFSHDSKSTNIFFLQSFRTL